MSIIRAREKFLRLQIKQAYLLADYYHALNDPTSAEAFEAWASSNHGLAERKPSPLWEEAAFVPERTFRHGTQQTRVRESGGHYELVTAGLAGTNETFTGRAPASAWTTL